MKGYRTALWQQLCGVHINNVQNYRILRAIPQPLRPRTAPYHAAKPRDRAPPGRKLQVPTHSRDGRLSEDL